MSIAIGGISDLYIIVGTNPIEIVADFQNFIVGLPTMPPAHALGWNQCRWGYEDTAALKAVVAGYEDNGIPLDNQWSDIDYMFNYRNFEIDQNRFSDLGEFVDDLHTKGMHYVPIVDAGIAYRPWGDYSAFTDGVDQDIFIKANSDLQNDVFIGEVWPNEAAYVDWFKSEAVTWWKAQLDSFASQVDFDGLWLDMNEASNFCTGPCKRDQMPDNSAVNNLLYIPTDRNLNTKSISVDAWHTGDVLEIDAHNLYGVKEVQATNEYFNDNTKRTFIISRS